jgi:hypothetical protein
VKKWGLLAILASENAWKLYLTLGYKGQAVEDPARDRRQHHPGRCNPAPSGVPVAVPARLRGVAEVSERPDYDNNPE